MALYNLKIEQAVEAETPEEAVAVLLSWIDNRDYPYRPFVEVNPDGTMNMKLIDSEELETAFIEESVDKAQCRRQGLHLKSCDDSGYCDNCGWQ